jgi:triosephosphate isomerase
MYSDKVSKNTRIVYGGSISPENAKDLFSPVTVSGGLVGSASLEVESFIEIINSTH